MYSSEFTAAAAEQLALDYGCYKRDFLSEENIVVPNIPKNGCRRIFLKPPLFRMATMGKNAVISADRSLIPFFEELITKYSGAELFSGRVQYLIGSELAELRHCIGDTHIYYLPQIPYSYNQRSSFDMRVFEEKDIELLHKHTEFKNALMYEENCGRRDVLAVCAFNGNNIVAAAGASYDSKLFRQIGIDVKKEFRELGIGSECIRKLTYEVISHGAIPYYGTWSGNIASQNTAMSAGYRPVWTEMFSQKI